MAFVTVVTAVNATASVLVLLFTASEVSSSEFQQYSTGYFFGILIASLLCPQYCMSVWRSQDRICGTPRPVTAPFTFCCLAGTVGTLFGYAVLPINAMPGCLSGLMTGCSSYLLTEVVAHELAYGRIKSLLAVRVIAGSFGCLLVVILLLLNVSRGTIAPLVAFETTRAAVIVLLLARLAITSPRAVSTTLAFQTCLLDFWPWHGVKICQVVLLTLIPFLISLENVYAAVGLRLGFALGNLLAGVTSTVVVPRILRQSDPRVYKSFGRPALHTFSIVAALAIANGGLCLHPSHSNSLVSWLVGAAYAAGFPLLAINGAIIIRDFGEQSVFEIWIAALCIVSIGLVLYPPAFSLIGLGVLAITCGYASIELCYDRLCARLRNLIAARAEQSIERAAA